MVAEYDDDKSNERDRFWDIPLRCLYLVLHNSVRPHSDTHSCRNAVVDDVLTRRRLY